MKRITRRDELTGDRYLIFKHSNRCLVSARAAGIVESLAPSLPVPVYQIIVHDERELSEAVAEELGVRHASPQVILVDGAAAVWHASHHGISTEAIRDAVGAR
jgi:bacillithiol system protein YtxJ